MKRRWRYPGWPAAAAVVLACVTAPGCSQFEQMRAAHRAKPHGEKTDDQQAAVFKNAAPTQNLLDH